MTKSQQQFTWIKDRFQEKDYQLEIFTGFDINKLSSICKIYMYSLDSDISINKIHEFNSLGSDLHYLSHGIHHFPRRSIFSLFLNRLNYHIDNIFDLSIEYIKSEIELDVSVLYEDGTVFEACKQSP